jgi:cellulose synthase/poly-beta-1,6-N-acetylglucosamine synthase-like glycosyltransferase
MLLFFVCTGLILYILVGYPVLLSWMARQYRRPVSVGAELRPVSIVVPVHNGARFLRHKLDSILALNYPRQLLQVLVVSDGSTDDTKAIALEYAEHGIELLAIPRSGKAAALNFASHRASGEILVFTDVRQDLHPDSLRLLVGSFHDPNVGVVSGELLLRTGTKHSEADVGFYWKYESRIRRNLSALDSMFGATGPFYAIRRELFTSVPEDILLDDVYLPMAVFFRNYRLVVEPRALAYDYPMARNIEFGRKVRTLAGNYQLLYRMPELLTASNRLLWHFVSYKLGRLLLPWLVVSLITSSFAFGAPWNRFLLSFYLLFCLLIIFDPYVPQRNFMKRFSSPARTFAVLLTATVVGLKVLFVPPLTLWKVTDIANDS